MKVIKFLIFIFILVLVVFIANITKIKKSEKNHTQVTMFNTSNIIIYDGSELKTLALINLSTSWETLSKIFETDDSNLRGKILKKTINILDSEAELIVFIGDNKINQITVIVERIDKKDILKTFPETIIENAKVINVPEEVYKIEDSNGDIIAKITDYKTSRYRLLFTEVQNEEGKVFTIELSDSSKN